MKLTQHCKPTILQSKFKTKKKMAGHFRKYSIIQDRDKTGREKELCGKKRQCRELKKISKNISLINILADIGKYIFSMQHEQDV